MNFIRYKLAKIEKKLANILDKMIYVAWKNYYESAKFFFKNINKKISCLLFIICLITFTVPPVLKKIAVKDLFHQGNEFYIQGQYEQAIKLYENVLKIDSRYYEALTNLGLAQGKLGNYYDMQASCEVATTIQKNKANAWDCLGVSHLNLNQYSEAITAFDKAIQLNPNEPFFKINKTEALLKQKSFLQALNTINQAVFLLDQNLLKNPDSQARLNQELAIAWNYKGSALRDLQQFSQSIQAYEKALQYNPLYYPAMIGKAISFQKDQQYKQALVEFDLILNHNSLTNDQKSEVLYYKGLTLLALKRVREGCDAFTQALTLKPDFTAAQKSQESCFD